MRGSSGSLPTRGKTANTLVVVLLAAVPLAVVPLSLSSPTLAAVCGLLLFLAATAPIFGLTRIGTGLVLVGMATVTFNNVHPIPGAGWMELSDPFLLLGFALLLPRLLGNPLRLPPAYLVGAIGLLSVGTLSALATPQPGENFSHLLDVVRGLVFLPVFYAWWRPGTRTTISMALAYMLGNCIDVVAAFVKGPLFDDRYAGFTTHPNVMGMCEVLSISLAPFLLGELRARHHWIVGLMAALSMVGVWITGSRAAFACAVILTLLYPLFNRSIPAALAVGGASLAAFAVLHGLAQNANPDSTLGRMLGEGSAQGSNDARAEGARDGIQQFFHHPLLGDGWLTIWGAHDAYIQIAAAVGFFGLMSYLMMVGGLLRPLFTLRRPHGLLAAPALAAVMLDIFLPVLGARYVWVVVGFALLADQLAEEQATNDSKARAERAEPSLPRGRR
ncbi:MAG: O-antigen ligase family protein [Aeromicrobium sp.]